MPYDPTYPVNNSALRADELRAQFTGLKDLIDAGPAVPTLDAVLAAGADANARTISNVGTLQVAFLMPVNGQPINVGADLALNEKHLTYVGNLLTVGVVKLLNLPTADPLTAGQLWNDGGTLKISAG